jgi:hypothetical protein
MPYGLIPRCIYNTNMQAVDSYHGVIHKKVVNPLNAELNPICHLLALLGAHPILHVSRIRVKIGVVVILQHLYGDTAFCYIVIDK